MTTLQIRPLCRAEQPGTNARFRIRLDGGEASSLTVRASEQAAGYNAHFADGTCTAPATGENLLTVEIPARASLA